MRILICDDNHFVVEEIKQYLEEYFSQKDTVTPELVSFSDGDSLLADQGKKDMVFLDIEMPGTNGIRVSSELKKTHPHIFIFITTSYDQYLDDAMDAHAFRYLSKPLDKDRLFTGMNRAMRAYRDLVSPVIIHDGETTKKIAESDIIYIDVQDKTTLVHTVSATYRTNKTIRCWINSLNACSFFQTSKSYIVNMKHVSSFDHQLISFSSCEDKAYLSKRKYHEFKRAYLFYLGHSH